MSADVVREHRADADRDTRVLFAAGRLFVYPSFQSPMGAEQAGDKVWLINPHGDTVEEGTLVGFEQLPNQLTSGEITAGMGSVWLRGYGSPVFRYDAHTLRLLGTYPADPSAGGYSVTGFGSLWGPNVETSTLWRDCITR